MNKYERLSAERKDLQDQGHLPMWFSTGGWQMFKEKYLFGTTNPREQYRRIAKQAASHMPEDKEGWEERFFEILWKGWLSPSTPVLANTGTDRGMSVSCSGGFVDDSIDGFYSSLHEAAMLTKNGFGTSGYLGDIRPRGSDITSGGKASGVLPVYEDHVIMTRKVAQGTARRGAWAGYIEADHGDFHELIHFIKNNPDDSNIGWLIGDKYIERLDAHDADAIDRFQEMMHMKAILGKGYFVFPDKANRLRPMAYVINNLFVKASNLCSEIMLFSDAMHTFTCVLSSMNAALYDEWKDTDAPFVAIVFLDCIAEDFIVRARKVPGLAKAVRFTEKGRALGLGVCGFHTYLQSHMMPFDSPEAASFNMELFSHIRGQAEAATAMLAKLLGEPEWCKGLGRRNTHLMAIAPTKSTALIMGGVSEGINPDPAMTFTQTTAVGEVDRANPVLLRLMKERGVYDDKHMQELVDSQGSVQGVDWLSNFEKEVFKTAFEINQRVIIELASARQIFIDQGQSLNLFFSADEDEAYIAEIHELAFNDPYILALYYMYSKAGVTASKGECLSCM
jgi:ribonucleoside-diphosphate reductase alpha chain